MMLRKCILLAAVFFCFFTLSGGETFQVTLLGTSDVHGHFDGDAGGFFKLAALITARRSSCANVILADCGDTMQGSFAAYRTLGALPARVLSELKYDCFTPGNHDFEFGGSVLARRVAWLRSAGIAVLAANVGGGRGPGGEFAPFRIFDFGRGIKVGVIGMTEDLTPYRTPDIAPYFFRDEKKALRGAVDALLCEKVSAIVLVRHNGLYSRSGTLSEFLREFPEIDAVLGGHSHTLESGRKVGNALYVQPGRHGEALAEITMEFSVSGGRLQQVRGRLHMVNSETVADAALRKALKKDLDAVDAAGMRRLPGTSAQADPALLALEAMLRAHPADVAVHWGARRAGQLVFPVTAAELYLSYPFANRICRIELSAGELREFLEEQCELETRDKYRRFFFSGVEAVRDNRGGLVRLELDKPCYSVVLSDYLLAGAGRQDSFLARRKLRAETLNGPMLIDAVSELLVSGQGR